MRYLATLRAGLPYHDRDKFRVIVVLGDFDLSNVSKLGAAIERALECGRVPALDFSQTRYVDSSVLNLIARSAGSGSRVRVIVPAACAIRRVFDITGLSAALGAVETADALR